MNNVIGPIDAASWITLKELAGSIKEMEKRDKSKYRLSIDRERLVYNYTLDEFKNNV